MDPQEYLKQLLAKLQQQYRNVNASTTSIGANNPFNNAYFQQLTRGQLGASGLSPTGAQGGQYANDLSGVFKGLLDRMQEVAQPAFNAASNGVSQTGSALHDGWNKLISSFR